MLGFTNRYNCQCCFRCWYSNVTRTKFYFALLMDARIWASWGTTETECLDMATSDRPYPTNLVLYPTPKLPSLFFHWPIASISFVYLKQSKQQSFPGQGDKWRKSDRDRSLIWFLSFPVSEESVGVDLIPEIASPSLSQLVRALPQTFCYLSAQTEDHLDIFKMMHRSSKMNPSSVFHCIYLPRLLPHHAINGIAGIFPK